MCVYTLYNVAQRSIKNGQKKDVKEMKDGEFLLGHRDVVYICPYIYKVTDDNKCCAPNNQWKKTHEI